MGINELNEAWIAAGQKVSDLDNKLSLRGHIVTGKQIGRAHV